MAHSLYQAVSEYSVSGYALKAHPWLVRPVDGRAIKRWAREVAQPAGGFGSASSDSLPELPGLSCNMPPVTLAAPTSYNWGLLPYASDSISNIRAAVTAQNDCKRFAD